MALASSRSVRRPADGGPHCRPVRATASAERRPGAARARAGDVVVFVDDAARPRPARAAAPAHRPVRPPCCAAGGRVILDRRPGTKGVVALRLARTCARRVAADPQLQDFADYWLGRGADALAMIVRASTRCASRWPRSTPTVGDIEGNERARSASAIARARDAGRPARAVPRAGAHRLPARGPAAQGALPRATRARRSSGSPPRREGIVALVGFPERADDVYNAAAVLADGARARPSTARSTCPTTASSTRSATSRRRRAAALVRARRRHDRPDDLRGHLGARAARHRRGARRARR